jgi:hypothetical protein
MALAELGNIAANLLNQVFGQNEDAQSGTTHVTTGPAVGTNVLPEDRFTHSPQDISSQTAAQEAGLFQVTQFSTLSVAVDITQSQAATPLAVQNSVHTQNVQPAAANTLPRTSGSQIAAARDEEKSAEEDRLTPSAQSNSTHTTTQEAGLFQVTQVATLSVAADFLQTQAATPQAAQNSAPAPAAQPVVAPATPQATAPQIAISTSTATPASSVQSQLQALNTALAALGLNSADIQSLDRVASLIKDFNPVAYTSLVFQLEALAQQVSQPTTTGANAATTSVGANAGGGSFKVQELVINFSGLQGTVNSGTANGNSSGQQGANGTTAQFSAFNLQVQEVQLTLSNNNGQTVQVHAPQQNVGVATGARSATQAKAVAA